MHGEVRWTGVLLFSQAFHRHFEDQQPVEDSMVALGTACCSCRVGFVALDAMYHEVGISQWVCPPPPVVPLVVIPLVRHRNIDILPE